MIVGRLPFALRQAIPVADVRLPVVVAPDEIFPAVAAPTDHRSADTERRLGTASKRPCLSHEGSGNTRQRQGLSHDGGRNTRQRQCRTAAPFPKAARATLARTGSTLPWTSRSGGSVVLHPPHHRVVSSCACNSLRRPICAYDVRRTCLVRAGASPCRRPHYLARPAAGRRCLSTASHSAPSTLGTGPPSRRSCCWHSESARCC